MNANLNAAIPGPVLWDEVIPGGAHWSGVMRRGLAFRLTDLEGRANLSGLFWNFEERAERYNMPDTLKAQHAAFLTRGHCGYSDMGRTLFSITDDTSGWHDTICGVLDDKTLRERYGERRFQAARNAMFRSGKEGLLKEMGRWGLSPRDLHANVNFFSKVTAKEDGALIFDEKASRAGAHVDIRFDMDVLVAFSAAPHPLDLRTDYAPGAVRLQAWRAGIAPAEDLCRNACGESQRAFINTARYFGES
jgi:urea carboxylase-associated protein 2